MLVGKISIYVLIAVLIVGLVIGGWISRWIIGSWSSYKVRSRLTRGVKKEEEAASWLKKNGYKIVDYQCKLNYQLKVNQKLLNIAVSPDFRVSKNGKEQLIEVKSGNLAPRLENKDTRRQLLEYHYIEPETPIYLLDMERNELKAVEFSEINKAPSTNWKLYAGVLIGIGISVGVYWLFAKR